MNGTTATNRSVTAETLLATAPATESIRSRPRLDSLDWLRGLVMVVMALDHARDFLGAGQFNPRDVNDASLFVTRWITHFCAPTFIFLAGMSAHLYGTRGRSRSEVSRFLMTRGLWLVLMELLIVRFAWGFAISLHLIVLQVIWAIGVSLMCLSALIYLPRPAIAAFAAAMIAGHNLLDSISAKQLGSVGWLWMVLHQQGPADAGKMTLMVIYPLVPWVGVMAAGYLFGPAIQSSSDVRRRWTFGAGLGLICLFVLLRAANVYGDPQKWSVQATLWATVLSFVNCEKYPPSLLYLCMTLGPALVLLGAAQRFKGALASVVVTFGRVPFLFYVAHIVVLHLIAAAWAELHYGNAAWLFSVRPFELKPASYGVGLPMIYAMWLTVVAMLYPVCRWFAEVKQRRREWWLSYL